MNHSVLDQLSSPQDVLLIKTIKLSRFATQDKLICPYTKDLQYTVKSGYWALTHDLCDGDIIQSPRGSISLVWKLNILPKIKQFLWNVLSGAVPTYVQLCSRGVKVDPTCQRCCYEEESINHALFKCPHAFAIWRCSNSPLVSQFSDNLEENINLIFQLMNDLS